MPELPKEAERAGRQRHRAGPPRRPHRLATSTSRSRRSRTSSRRSTSRRGCARCSSSCPASSRSSRSARRSTRQVQDEMGRNQREYFLRQQLKAIKEELGEIDEAAASSTSSARRSPTAKMPPEAEKVAHKQLKRLKGMQPSSAEYTVTRTYLEWLVELPWSISTEDNLDIAGGAQHPRRGSLRPREGEEAHPRVPGGAQAQERQEGPDPLPRRARPASARPRSAARSRARSAASSCASRSAACATRPRSAATGAPTSARCPGRIIQGMKKAGTNNPVFVLDEIDKLGHDFRGDPAAALLEVLDPEQNNTLLAITTSTCRSTCRR